MTFTVGDRVRLVYDIGVNSTRGRGFVREGERGIVTEVGAGGDALGKMFPLTVWFDDSGEWPVRPEEIVKEEI